MAPSKSPPSPGPPKTPSTRSAIVRVDVILLDLEMPGAGGLQTLPRIIEAARGARVMIVSSLAEDGAEETIAALALGAADTLPKPGTGRFNGRFSEILVSQLRALGHVEHKGPRIPEPLRQRFGIAAPRDVARSRSSCSRSAPRPAGSMRLAACSRPCRRRIGIPILVTQHLPAAFMTVFARQLGVAAKREAVVAEDGMALAPRPHPHRPRRRPPQGRACRQGQLVARLDRKRSASGCLPSVDPMFASAAAVLGSGGARRGAYRHGPRRGRRGHPAGRLRRLDHRPGRGQLRGLGHAARGRRSRAGLRGDAARQDRPPDRRSRGRALRGSKRQLEPHSRRLARGAHGTAIDDEPALADRDRSVVAAARTRHRQPRRADHHPRHGQGAGPCQPGGRGPAQQRNLFLPRPHAVRPAQPPMRCPRWPSAGHRRAASASGRPAARPGRKPIRWRCCSPRIRALGGVDDRHPRHRRLRQA